MYVRASCRRTREQPCYDDRAVTRLAEAVGLHVRFNTEAAKGIEIVRASEGLRSAWEINEQSFWHYRLAELVGYLGLIRLAFLSGYVALSGWEFSEWIAVKVASLKEVDHPGMLNVRGLAHELETSLMAGPANSVAFDAFESYLSLTRWVFSDQPLIDALNFVHSDWDERRDSAALLSPRHMASALATGRVGVVEVQGFAGMLQALQALEWLVSIVNRVKDVPDLRDGMLAHAHWSHAVWVSRQRVDEWALAMSEWSPQPDTEGEARWDEFREQVLLPLEAEQDRLALDKTNNARVVRELDPAELLWSSVVELDQLDARVSELLKEGRDEAARRTLILALDDLSRTVAENPSDVASRQLLEFAQRLADLGDLDSAAAYVAPYPNLFTAVGDGPPYREIFATELIARARRQGTAVGPPLSRPDSVESAMSGLHEAFEKAVTEIENRGQDISAASQKKGNTSSGSM